MTDFLVSAQTVCEIPGFDPQEDILLIALPEDSDGGLDHALSFRRLKPRAGMHPSLEVGLTHHASGTQFRVRLPGLSRLSPNAIAVLSQSDAAELTALSHANDTVSNKTHQPKPQLQQVPADDGPRKLAFVHGHNWHIDGPPPVRSFDLSHPQSEISITLHDDTGGPIYAIRLTETHKGEVEGTDRQEHSIVLAQCAPGTPLLKPTLLGQWVENRLGSIRFRPICQISLGSEGHSVNPDTGEPEAFGQVNRDPHLAIHGHLAGSVAVER